MQVLDRASREARSLGHGAIRSEHILLGLVGAPNMRDLLATMGVTTTDIVAGVRDRVASGSRVGLDPVLRYTAEARDVLDCCLEEMAGYGHETLCSSHVLLGLIKEPDGVGGRVLESFGVSLDAMRHEVLEFLAAASPGVEFGLIEQAQ